MAGGRASVAGVGWVLYGIGWMMGWLLLWSIRPLPAGRRPRPPLAVVVPARDEAAALPHLLGPLQSQLADCDELVVVDDGSTDDTAAVAAAHRANVMTAPAVPTGWVGKPHACAQGALATTGTVLVFIDADVRPGPRLLDGVAAAVTSGSTAVASVQPWHDAVDPRERLAILANVVALMGSGAFTVLGRDLRTKVAFGPVLAMTRTTYERIGGHAHPDVRGSLTEDIAIATLAGRSGFSSTVFSSKGVATSRAHPGGLGPVVAAWSRTMAAGIIATRWWIALAVGGWVWSLAGGPFVGWPAYLLSALQVWVLGRRSGRVGVVVAALYPLTVLVLVAIVIGAGWHRLLGRTSWRGRTVRTR